MIYSIKIAINTLFFTLCDIFYFIVNYIKSKFGKAMILATWYSHSNNNFGDILTPILIEFIAGKKPLLANHIINSKKMPSDSVVGSILSDYSEENVVLWGSGFISATSKFEIKPKKICAVRGPLTRNLIIEQGMECPKIYGDPALLFPLYYRPDVKKQYILGVVPHRVDMGLKLLTIFKSNPDILIIDITQGVFGVVDDINRCNFIASSSLHGIIIADAYDIPSLWIKLSDSIIGDGFKYRDYFMSVGREDRDPFIISEPTTLQDVLDKFHDYKIDIDLNKLLEVCPFKKK